MKKILIIILTFTVIESACAQSIGIGTSTPNSSAILEIAATNKGLLIPRLPDTSSIGAPVKGLLMFSLASNKMWCYDGGRWLSAAGGGTDNLWYEAQTGVAHTNRPFVSVNSDLGILGTQANLQVTGSLLLQAKLDHTNAVPTTAQTYTMSNSGGNQIILGDSIFRLYDPGGTANYGNSMQGNVSCSTDVFKKQVGFKISSTATDFGLGTGDTLWLSTTTFPSCRTNYIHRFTNSSASPADFIINGSFFMIFRSNADGNNNKGFNFVLTGLYNSEPEAKIYTAGPALYFNSTIGALASGIGSEASGSASLAMGTNAKAMENNSVAMGSYVKAEGAGGIAIGNGVNASGAYSTAIGYTSTARGFAATALGYDNQTGADYAFATGSHTSALGYGSGTWGYDTEASGYYSAAGGYNTISRGFAGTVLGMNNDPVLPTPQNAYSTSTPLLIVGNGNSTGSRSNALVVLKSGFTGIGTNNPEANLHIDGGTDASLAIRSGYLIVGDVIGTNIVFDNNEIMARNNGASSRLHLQNDGGDLETGGAAFKPGGGSWTATSDARLKQYVLPYTDGLQQLLKINPVYYQYNQLSGYDSNKQYIGVIAQDLKEVAPYMVGTFTKNNTEYLNVDNTAMTYMLINSVKEQQAQIAAQQQLIANQQKQIDELRELVRKD